LLCKDFISVDVVDVSIGMFSGKDARKEGLDSRQVTEC
jgi:hypothetical protein